MKENIKKFFVCFFIVISFIILIIQPSFANTLKFAQISDIHYTSEQPDNTYKLLSHTKELLQDAIAQINKIDNIEFAVVTGDFINIPSENSLIDVSDLLNTLKMPWYAVIGNHDTSDSFTKEKFLKVLNNKNKDYFYANTYYSLVPQKGFKIIVLDGAKNSGISSNGKISDEQMTWLRGVLEKSKKDVVLIFIHFPIIEPYHSPNHKLVNSDELEKLLNEYKMPIAVLSGHYHMTKVVKRGHILHISTPSLAGYPHAFRIISIENSKKKVTFNIEFKETSLKDLQKKSKIANLGGSIYYGREHDRNITVTMDK